MTVLPSVLGSRTSSLSLSWDFDNRLSSADTNDDGVGEVFYQFDALGRRVGRTHESKTTVFVQSGQQTIADYDLGTPSGSPVFTYTYGQYIDEPVTRHANDGSVRYYHRNQQYSITAITNGGGSIVERYAYSAYGTPTITDASGTTLTTSADNNRYMYTGREFDEALRLYHYRARMYDSSAGRFCSKDPIGYVDGPSLYTYVISSPLSYQDPMGTSVFEVYDKCRQYEQSILAGLPPKCAANGWTLSLSCVQSNGQNLLPGEKGVAQCFSGKEMKIKIFYEEIQNQAGVDAAIAHELSHIEDFCTCSDGCEPFQKEIDGVPNEDFCRNSLCTEIRAFIGMGECQGLTPAARLNCLTNLLGPYVSNAQCSSEELDTALRECAYSENEPRPPFPF